MEGVDDGVLNFVWFVGLRFRGDVVLRGEMGVGVGGRGSWRVLG